MTEPIMKTVPGQGVSIQLARWGETGRTLFCIHGIAANCRCWDTLASTLAPEHRVIAMDLRGRGRSDHPPSGYSLHHHMEDILSVLDHLEIRKTAIMGHSMGASLAVALGALHPDRVERMVLMDGGGKLSLRQLVKVARGIQPSLDRLGRVFPSFEAYCGHMKKAPYFNHWTSRLEAYFRYDAEDVTGGVRSRIHPDHVREDRENMGKIDNSEYYGKIRCPVLILRATEGMLGDDDLTLPLEAAERMVAEILHARCVDIPGTNHYTIVFEQNDARDRTIADFLA